MNKTKKKKQNSKTYNIKKCPCLLKTEKLI